MKERRVIFYCDIQIKKEMRPANHNYTLQWFNIVQGGAKRTHVFFIFACDFIFWSYLKSKVYVRKPRTVDDLKVSIREEIATVPQEMLVNVMQNFEERLRTCVRQEGRHLSDIIFRN